MPRLRNCSSKPLRCTIARAEGDSGQLAIDVMVRNLTGHKLPTAYPSRRAWLHVTIRDRDGQVIFESGAIEPSGLIRGNDNDADGRRFEPHHTEIRATIRFRSTSR